MNLLIRLDLSGTIHQEKWALQLLMNYAIEEQKLR
jgi:hypothetical protein